MLFYKKKVIIFFLIKSLYKVTWFFLGKPNSGYWIFRTQCNTSIFFIKLYDWIVGKTNGWWMKIIILIDRKK